MNEFCFINAVRKKFSMIERVGGCRHRTSEGMVPPYYVIIAGASVGYMYLDWDESLVGGDVQLTYLYINEPKKGIGSLVLSGVCALADEYNISLSLMATPLKAQNKAISAVKLKEWYCSFGFKLSGEVGSSIMQRLPDQK